MTLLGNSSCGVNSLIQVLQSIICECTCCNEVPVRFLFFFLESALNHFPTHWDFDLTWPSDPSNLCLVSKQGSFSLKSTLIVYY